MVSYTAYIIIDDYQPNYEGNISKKLIYLSENSRPALIYRDGDVVQSKQKETVWIPTIENPIDDVFLMFSACLLKDETVLNKVEEFSSVKNYDYLELYEAFTEERRKALYELNREALKKHEDVSMVFVVLEGSLFRGSLKALAGYELDIEVCLSIYRRYNSPWRDDVSITGSLDHC